MGGVHKCDAILLMWPRSSCQRSAEGRFSRPSDLRSQITTNTVYTHVFVNPRPSICCLLHEDDLQWSKKWQHLGGMGSCPTDSDSNSDWSSWANADLVFANFTWFSDEFIASIEKMCLTLGWCESKSGWWWSCSWSCLSSYQPNSDGDPFLVSCELDFLSKHDYSGIFIFMNQI